MRVEVTIAHGPWGKGEIIPEMPSNMADWKIARGLVRELSEKAMQSPLDRMMRKGVKK